MTRKARAGGSIDDELALAGINGCIEPEGCTNVFKKQMKGASHSDSVCNHGGGQNFAKSIIEDGGSGMKDV